MADEVKAESTQEQKDASEVKLEGKMKEFVEWVETISVLELSHLVKALEKRFGVTAAAPMMAMPGMAAGGAAAGAAQEAQTEFTVVLTNIGAQKIQVIKEIRTITGLGLKESKDLVEGAPKTVKEGLSKEDAGKMKEKLEAVGAKAEIK